MLRPHLPETGSSAPSNVISSPAALSAFPTSRFPMRNEIASAAPEAETPIGPKSFTPKILHGGKKSRRLDMNHRHAFSLAANSSREIGTKRTLSPMDSKLMPARSGRNIAKGVRPSNLQPPGVANGYTPVWRPAIPTLPGGTIRRGFARRGVISDSGTSPR